MREGEGQASLPWEASCWQEGSFKERRASIGNSTSMTKDWVRGKNLGIFFVAERKGFGKNMKIDGGGKKWPQREGKLRGKFVKRQRKKKADWGGGLRAKIRIASAIGNGGPIGMGL